VSEFREYQVVANGIRQHVIEAGSGSVVLLCHGFPELAHSWRHQLRALADAGYRAIAPDMRGYGRTDAPPQPDRYTILHLVGDMVGLLDVLDVRQAAIVGHDWGAPVAWTAAQMRPDMFTSVAGMCVPFAPRGPASSLEAMRRAGRHAFYQLYFQQAGVAERDFDADIDATVRRMMWTLSAGPQATWNGMIGAGGALDALAEPSGPMHWLGTEDLAVYAAAFRASGFTGALNWYRNIDRNWELTAPFQHCAIRQPAWFIAGERDPIYPFVKPLVDALPQTVPGHLGTTIVPGAGHWVQQEAAHAVNGVLLDFLRQAHVQPTLP
jgi:pimeloyl-ACP methyl ester carboxylesterase